jgi:hypothetical protein
MLTLFVGSSAAADPPAGCTTTAGVTTCVFAYTGAAQTWTVPDGVTEATFDLYGGRGADDAASGGLGGQLTATVAVAGGASIQVNVGGAGTLSFSSHAFNGGGAGCRGGGGGASDIRIGGTALADRKLVAGGGGGSAFGNGIEAGGAGGGVTGDPGVLGPFSDSFVGGGGTQTAGGTAGDIATPGSFGVGGDAFFFGVDGCTDGGGGGGGWYGGGGGVGAGGGGGSSYPDPSNPPSGVTNVTTNTGVRSGNGLATISYSACQQTGFYRDGINLTARQIGGNVTGTLDATGCNIGVYYGPGATGTVSGTISGSNYYGVVADRAAVNVTGATIHDIGETQPNGSQHGVGVLYTTIELTSDPSNTHSTVSGHATGTLSGTSITNYQKNGVVISGAGANVTAQSNTVTGYGMINYIAQNGIEVASGASALVKSNTVSGNWYTPKSFVACGLLFFQAGGVKQSGNNLFNNEVNLCNAGRGGGNFKP